MDKRILILKTKITANLKNDWTLNKLARESNIAKSQLVKLFQTDFGFPPVQFIRNIRLEKACELLETTFLRVKEIMFAVGIRDQSHFVRDFKKKYGATPTEYRDCHYEKLASEITLANKSE